MIRFRVKDHQLNIRMNRELKQLAEQAAPAEMMSLSNYIDELIVRDLKARGFLDGDGKPVKAKASKLAGKRK